MTDHTEIAPPGIDADIRTHGEIEVQNAVEEKDRFVAVLSHELGNHLAVISTSFHILSSDRCDHKQRAEAVTLLGRQIKRMTRLVNDTLDISRLTSGRISLCLAPLDLGRVAVECCEDLGPSAKESGFTLEVKADTDHPMWVNGDETRLSQCLNNLINNSMKFSPSPGTIRVTVGQRDNTAILAVQDSGIGMEQKEIEKLFRPFEQGIGAKLMCGDGLGLGLAVVKELVGLHQGQVDVVSPGRGKGTTFRIILATCEAPAHQAVSEPASQKPVLKVLLVEDNPRVLRSLEIFFQMEGSEVRTAKDGETALERISEQIPDIVFCDLSLPGSMKGWDIAERIVREIPSSTRPLLIALSGHIQKKFVQRSLDAGFDHHLPKPTSPAELRKYLEYSRDHFHRDK